MLKRLIALALLALSATAVTVGVEPDTTECFYEELKQGETLTLSFDVFDAQDTSSLASIDFHMTDATGRIIQSAQGKDVGYYTATADRDGRWTFCFNNHGGFQKVFTVAFFVHETDSAKKKKSEQSEIEAGKIDPVDREIKSLAAHMQDVRDHQQYIMAREGTHRNTAESTNDRVKWWGIFQLGIVVFLGFFQVSYLKQFFTVRRVV